MRVYPLLAVVLFVFSSATHAADTTKIFKCKDAQGRWHYGSAAAAECARSAVTVMSGQGTTRKVIDAPPTEAEIKQREARKAEEDREKQDTEAQARQDKILLSTYTSVEELEQARVRKLSEMEKGINSSVETLKSLQRSLERLEAQAGEEKKAGKPNAKTTKALNQARKQVERHETQIAKRRKEMEDKRKQFDLDLKRYRELKRLPPARSAGR